MAERFTTFYGMVAFDFDPSKDVREFNGKKVRKFMINAVGEDKPVQIDLWPDYEDVVIKRGDIVMAAGKATSWDRVNPQGDQVRTWQMQPYVLKVNDEPLIRSKPPSSQQKTNPDAAVKRKTSF